jgi:DUF2971 family protein
MLEIVFQLLSRAAPPILYHYTTQDGLLGITRDRAIWATMSRYLNDTSEFRFAQQLARDIVSTRLEKESDRVKRLLLSHLLQAVENAGINVCVCSFTPNGDLLSQWRAYSGAGTGYSIGFDTTYLKSFADRYGYILAPCLYNRAEQVTFLSALIDDTLAENLADYEKNGEPDALRIGGNLRYYLNRYALIMKDPAFAEEQEWRLISRPVSFTSDSVCFRSGRSSIIPYEVLPFLDDGRMPIVQVIVGPSPHSEEAVGAVDGLLFRRFDRTLDAPHVTSSSVPYRHW